MFEYIDQQILEHEKCIDMLYRERRAVEQCIHLVEKNKCILRVTDDNGTFTVVVRHQGKEGICASKRLIGAIQGALVAIGILSHIPLSV